MPLPIPNRRFKAFSAVSGIDYRIAKIGAFLDQLERFLLLSRPTHSLLSTVIAAYKPDGTISEPNEGR